MSGLNWKLENDLCRCCHAEGSFINLGMPCEDHAETYSDMLKNCLDINVIPVEGGLCELTYTICENCILRLRDASNFKRQVLMLEERFKEMYSKNFIKTFSGVKEELPDTYPDAFKEEDYSPHMDDNGFDLMQFTDVGNNGMDVKGVVKIEKKGKGKAKPKAVPKKKVTRKKVARRPQPQAAEGNDEGVDAAEEDKKTGGPVFPQGPVNTLTRFFLRDNDYTKDGDVYTCSRCDKKYDKIISLKIHVKRIHYKIPKYICTHCKKTFMTLAPFTAHKLEEHNVDDRFHCKACNSFFTAKIQLKEHTNNFHMLGKKYKCDSCDYESFSVEALRRHKFKHKTAKDYHCRFCKKSFLRKTTLNFHERIHTGDRRKVCKVCDQAFVQKASLNYHMTKYHPEVNF